MKLISFLIILNVSVFSMNARAQIKFGIFADCQYCDCAPRNTRFYQNSLQKLETAVTHFNEDEELEFVVNLGDLIDRDFESFDKTTTVLEKLKTPVFHVIGNHDLEVKEEHRKLVPEKLGMQKLFYTIEKENWVFIFLNGNDISFHSDNPETVLLAKEMTAKLEKNGRPNYHPWNGGIGILQLRWLNNQLALAQKQNKKAVLFCHYPLLPHESHTLWNSEEVLAVLKEYSCVKLWMNGHNHAGNYAFQNGIHFVNLKGMVESETENAFAEVVLTQKQIRIEGFGKEESRKLNIE
ncbi:Calcineurin-like phosphoesterase [Mariniphaga anaerophila]|uniref:Calcineurin-like phosphoesterase n=1 Tax=Mariniphaga anaerophila TaxID=1484053 RepID=A0A1M4TS16_9BACT|nr:metallophosphoesterase [Mariniphaga anaerophila]SHE47243.1 Calcineurin-like phosphoesterase [Mariniphaga anaerophila]